jgi:hypothetical protein
MTEEKKKATDVLLEMQHQLDVLTKICQDNNANIKQLRNEIAIERRSNKNINANVSVHQDAPGGREVLTSSPQAPTETNKHSVIEQTLLYKSNQRGVALADVKIYDVETGSMIKKALTGPNGKWDGLLPAGKYRIEIKKGPAAGQKAFIIRDELEVKGDGAPIILERKLV